MGTNTNLSVFPEPWGILVEGDEGRTGPSDKLL